MEHVPWKSVTAVVGEPGSPRFPPGWRQISLAFFSERHRCSCFSRRPRVHLALRLPERQSGLLRWSLDILEDAELSWV